MHRAPTRQRGGRGVSFAPLAQNDSDLLGPNDDVSQRWENLTATDDIRTRIHSIFRNTAPMVEDDEDDGLQHVRPRGHSAAYAPVGNLVSGTVAQEANIAELAGAPTEYYAPYPRAPSALSKLSDAPTETTDLGSTYSGFEPGDKYLHYAPRIASVQVREESPGSQPPELPDFKPFVLRRIFLSVLLLIVTVLFVLMIVAIRVLPDDTQSLATGLISRNSSKVKPRSLGVEPQVSWIPHHMNIRQNGNSTVMPSTVSSASDPIESPSSIPSTSSTSTSTTTTTTTSSTTSTLSTMTTSSTIAPSSTVLSSTSTRETSSTTTTTTPSDTQPQKPSKGSDVPPSTILSESTVVKPTSTADTKTTATTEKEQPTDTGPTATDHNSPPSDGGNNSGGEKTRSHAGEPQPTKSAPITTGSNPSSTSDPAPSENDSSLTTTVVTTAQQSQPSTSDAKPTGGESQTSPPDVSTVTTSTYQIPSSQDNQPPPVYTTSSNGEDGSPHLTTGLPLVTCTIDIIQTYVQWFTIPAVTVNLGLSVGRRYAAVDASRVRRQAAVCDTTVTITHDSTIMRTTALTTITIGLGNEQPGPTPTSTINYSSGSVQTEIYTVQTSVPLTVPTTSSAVDGTSSTYDQTVPDDTATGSPTTPDQGITSTTTVQIPDATSQPGVSTNTQGTGTQATSSQLITQPSDNQPTGTQFTVTQYTNTQPSRTEPSNAESSRHETTGTQATGTEPTDSQSSNNQPVGNQPTDTTPNSQPTNAIPSGTAPSSTATNGKSATVTGLTTIIYPTGSTVINSYALDTSQADIHSSFSTATELVITTDISSFTEINTALTAAANSTTLVDDPPRLGPNTNVATVGAVSASSRSGIGQQGPIETHEEPPVPFTTTAYVIESTNVVQTVVSKVTIPPSTAETDNALAVGAVFMTSVEVTSVFYDTRLATLQVLHGVMPNSDDGLQVLMATTLTDDYGHPTSTMTLTKYGYLTTQTLTDSLGFATSTKINSVLKYPSVTTITDSSGKVRVKTYYSKLTTATLRNSNGVATTTQVLEITETPTVVTEFDAAGHATKTITKMVPDGTSTSVSWVTATKASNASMQQVHYDALPISSSGYFTGILLPTLLAIGLAIPIRILDQTVKLYQPFSAMTWSYGARTADSLYLNTTGIWGLISGLTSPRNGNWLLAVTGLLVVANSVLIALSPEAFQVAVQKSGCTTSDDGALSTCPTSLGISSGPAKVVACLLCLMVPLLGVALWGLWRRRTGVKNDQPWSMFEISQITKNGEVMQLVRSLDPGDGSITRNAAITSFGKRRFVLGYWLKKSGWRYGVKISNDQGDFNTKKKRCSRGTRSLMPFSTLSWTGRASFLLLLLGLLLMILLYHNTGGGFQKFMDRENFGGRFILTGLGVIISLLWWTFFSCVAFLSPYQMYLQKKSIDKAVYLSPPSDPFSGFWRVISGQPHDIHLGVVAFAAILSELLPLFLGNIPTRFNDSDNISTVCVWLAVSIICVMIIALVWSFLVTWPPMPIDPSTIAGAMFYAMHVPNYRDIKSLSLTGARSSPV